MRAAHLRGMVIETDGTPEQAFEQARARLSLSDRPEAIFAATDRLAIAALAAAHDLGLAVPRDLAIIGFDDIPLAQYLRPGLSTVQQPATQLGIAALGLALRVANGETVEPVVLPAKLIVRESSAYEPG